MPIILNNSDKQININKYRVTANIIKQNSGWSFSKKLNYNRRKKA